MKSFRPFLAIAAALLLYMVGVNGALGAEGGLAPVNPAFEMYVSDILKGKEVAVTPEGYGLGHMPPPVDLEALNPEMMLATEAPPLGLPTAYDWRTSPGYSAVTSVKNQASCGSCWAFGNIGAIESNYKKNIAGHPTLDLSEDNMIDIRDSGVNKYCHWPWIWTRCGGGNTWTATSYLTGLVKKSATLQFAKGVLTEANDTYNSTAGYLNPKCTATRPNPIRRIDGTRWVSSDTTSLKNAVYTKGPVVTAYYAESPGGAHWYSSNTIYHYPGYAGSTNHEVLIVGWDDNKAHPTGGGKGAWLIKNSWGSFNSMGGFFWLTYGSAKVGSDAMYYTSTRPFNAKEQLYMEDLPGYLYNWGWGTATAYGLTVFVPLNTGEKLTHVEFYQPWASKAVTIKVWGTVTSTSSSATVSTLKASKTYTCQEPGYYTVALTTPIALTKGKKYAVEIKFTGAAGATNPIPVAGPYSGVVGSFAGQGNATGYVRSGATGAFSRPISGGVAYPPDVRARTARP
jgi:C1A family cysteine protease